MYPDFVWGVVDSKTAHTQKAFARLGYCKSDATPLVVVCAVAASLSPSVSPDNAGFMAGDNPKTDGGTWSEEYHSDPR